MSWNAQFLFVSADERPDDLAALIDELGVLGDPAATGEIDFAGAASMAELTDVAATYVDGWVVIAGLPVMLAGDEGLAERSARGEVVLMALGGAASVYAFSVFSGGAKIRAFVEQEGAVIRDDGDPLEAESGIDETVDEVTEFRVIEIVGRLTVELGELEHAAFETFTGMPAFN